MEKARPKVVDYGCGRKLSKDDPRVILDRVGNDISDSNYIHRYMWATYQTCGGDHPSGRKVYCQECAVSEGLRW